MLSDPIDHLLELPDFGPDFLVQTQDLEYADIKDPLEQELVKLRRLLGLLVLAQRENVPVEPLQLMVKAHLKSTLPSTFQLGAVLRTLCLQLAGVDANLPKPIHLAGGAAPIDASGDWPWASLPHLRWHAELGAFWAILGYIQGSGTHLDAACKISLWQRKLLDADFFPSQALFSREDHGAMPQLLAANAFLFHAIAVCCQDPHSEFLAKRQLFHLEERYSGRDFPNPYRFFTTWLDCFGSAPAPQAFHLPARDWDSSCQMQVFRGLDSFAALSLQGGGTGIAGWRLGGTELITCGPQRDPLGDCSGFGIEHLHTPSSSLSASLTEMSPLPISMEERLPLPGLNSPHEKFTAGMRRSVGQWMDCKLGFSGHRLSIDVLRMGLDVEYSASFCFYLKAARCLLEDGTLLEPRSLDRYEGPVQAVVLGEGGEGLTIEASGGEMTLQIVPLAGLDVFWGADYLLAYSMPVKHTQYSWKVSSLIFK